MSKLVIFAASLAGIALLVGLAWALGFRNRDRIDEARLRALAQDAAPGAEIVRVRIDADGRAGLAWLADSRVLTAAVMGDRIAVRLWREDDVRFDETARGLQVEFPDLGYPGLVLKAAR
jgi:Mg2+/citrate symporter